MTKILIVYDSKLGSTKGIAEYIGKILLASGTEVEVKHISETIELTEYKTVIIGSAIRYSNWLRPIRKFVKENRDILQSKSIYYFFVCLAKVGKTESARKEVENIEKNVLKNAPEIKPKSIGKFAGTLSYKGIPIYLSIILKLFMKIKGLKPGDYRQWDEIKDWTNMISNLH
jgi:menaquinone-dependent protoporphyrinogen oxidase